MKRNMPPRQFLHQGYNLILFPTNQYQSVFLISRSVAYYIACQTSICRNETSIYQKIHFFFYGDRFHRNTQFGYTTPKKKKKTIFFFKRHNLTKRILLSQNRGQTTYFQLKIDDRNFELGCGVERHLSCFEYSLLSGKRVEKVSKGENAGEWFDHLKGNLGFN